ncbi:Anaphase-promoting complex subunit 5 [Seinonella peptonophila]|uniref:Anaphase-promoting complex subunit 5 n=1 Tax=Seinonella peptonophila TaxID=112248 RepID=A0A1M4YAQ5_9BACL|nr:tetratricopeptide repeat protein [Seinonella peptonophila]SHF02854.1 Anaphase-promoting complex subunit 5 [Seinonella peptonophila]
METFDTNLVSYLARKTRITAGKTIKDVAFSISPGTASHIETQEKTVSPKKVYDYLENLGIEKNQVPNQLEEIKKEIEQVQFSLELIFMMFESGNIATAQQKLQDINLPKYHPYYSYYVYLKARNLRHQQNWKEAIRIYNEAIKIYNKNNYSIDLEFIPTTYNSLSVCAFYLDEISLALEYVITGLSHCDQSNKTKDIYYTLKRNQILYLERLGNLVQAFELINKIWPDIHSIDKTQVKLSFYKSKVSLLLQTKRYEEAIQFAKEGIKIARNNKELNRFFDLLNILGKVFTEIDNWEEAKSCFEHVLSYPEDGFPNKQVDALLNLASLYSIRQLWKKCKTALDSALNICNHHQIDIYRMSRVLIAYGDNYRSQNKYEEALKYYNEVIRTAKEHNLLHIHYFALFHSLDCLLNLGDEIEFTMRNKELYLLQKQPGYGKRSLNDIPTIPHW